MHLYQFKYYKNNVSLDKISGLFGQFFHFDAIGFKPKLYLYYRTDVSCNIRLFEKDGLILVQDTMPVECYIHDIVVELNDFIKKNRRLPRRYLGNKQEADLYYKMQLFLREASDAKEPDDEDDTKENSIKVSKGKKSEDEDNEENSEDDEENSEDEDEKESPVIKALSKERMVSDRKEISEGEIESDTEEETESDTEEEKLDVEESIEEDTDEFWDTNYEVDNKSDGKIGELTLKQSRRLKEIVEMIKDHGAVPNVNRGSPAKFVSWFYSNRKEKKILDAVKIIDKSILIYFTDWPTAKWNNNCDEVRRQSREYRGTPENFDSWMSDLKPWITRQTSLYNKKEGRMGKSEYRNKFRQLAIDRPILNIRLK